MWAPHQIRLSWTLFGPLGALIQNEIFKNTHYRMFSLVRKLITYKLFNLWLYNHMCHLSNEYQEMWPQKNFWKWKRSVGISKKKQARIRSKGWRMNRHPSAQIHTRKNGALLVDPCWVRSFHLGKLCFIPSGGAIFFQWKQILRVEFKLSESSSAALTLQHTCCCCCVTF